MARHDHAGQSSSRQLHEFVVFLCPKEPASMSTSHAGHATTSYLRHAPPTALPEESGGLTIPLYAIATFSFLGRASDLLLRLAFILCGLPLSAEVRHFFVLWFHGAGQPAFTGFLTFGWFLPSAYGSCAAARHDRAKRMCTMCLVFFFEDSGHAKAMEHERCVFYFLSTVPGYQ